MTHNRNYFDKPLQANGRSAPDYGRTALPEVRGPLMRRVPALVVALMLFALVAAYRMGGF